jgi:hypothetical protein
MVSEIGILRQLTDGVTALGVVARFFTVEIPSQ